MTKTVSSLLGALCALSSTAAFAAGPLTLDAALRNKKLDSREGDTYLRISVKAQAIHLDKRLPMNLAVVIDRSGSMAEAGPSGSEKMGDAKTAAKFLVDQLDERDTLTVISFDDGAEVLSPAAKMTAENKSATKERINPLYARGSTDMIAGLKAGLAQVKERVGMGEQVNRVILISDGQPNVADGLVDLARDAQARGISISTLGVGVDYNENLMTAIANAGNGGYYFVADASKLPQIFTKELHSLMAVVAKNAALKIEFGSGLKPIKVYGYDAQVGPEATIIRLGDVVGGSNSEVLLKVHHPALGGDRPVAHVELMYQDAFKKDIQKEERDITASFVEDKVAIESSLDSVTYARVEQEETAEAVNTAMDAYASGDKAKAKQVLNARRAQIQAAPKPVTTSTASAPMMERAKKSLDFADEAVMDAPAASMGYSGAAAPAAAAKAAKEDAYEMSR
jgi:Ca-activated chloride channel family protein